MSVVHLLVRTKARIPSVKAGRWGRWVVANGRRDAGMEAVKWALTGCWDILCVREESGELGSSCVAGRAGGREISRRLGSWKGFETVRWGNWVGEGETKRTRMFW
ncbi:hypothetical protein JI435_404040 [Parastagonospora nodorum SN15]|uniref:Uncharacterized protein n=1 Tax=Phaeosphaeria nodorum (strain SN15 / ATCC MYA-4574 / FGSC 10173) TaxID=321614 RepID=A0A7U2HYN3_PHANO|nr:hypothetical protein JI435_404040 [Parastagonospora nodorum SN15]